MRPTVLGQASSHAASIGGPQRTKADLEKLLPCSQHLQPGTRARETVCLTAFGESSFHGLTNHI